MSFRIRFTPEAEADLLRLFDFWIERDPSVAKRARVAIGRSMKLLAHAPFAARKAVSFHRPPNPRFRELIIPFGSSGYVALFEIDDRATVTVLAVRHQREDDCL